MDVNKLMAELERKHPGDDRSSPLRRHGRRDVHASCRSAPRRGKRGNTAERIEGSHENAGENGEMRETGARNVRHRHRLDDQIAE